MRLNPEGASGQWDELPPEIALDPLSFDRVAAGAAVRARWLCGRGSCACMEKAMAEQVSDGLAVANRGVCWV
ncbi:hypothetical protein [Acidipila sp. EB88]|uniref:hypothetical protein n=1 Tax=Acidipila sp. EB88 TaxID=2305226 RepID=UPI000F5EB24D|nr:hypothetical protein [Acidipila sp. EB88]RRA48268.1 hypothetical protein D1Y84_08160 [Acidipila sp. EB88]